MDRRFRAIATIVASTAIAIAVISHRNHHYRNSVIGGPIMVLVATHKIQKGTPGDLMRATAGWYQLEGVAQQQVEAGAIANPVALAGKVALTDIPQGSQLTRAEFRSAVVSGAFPGATQRAVVITPSQEIGGKITPGSNVGVWVGAHKRGKLRELYRKMQVLATNDATFTLRALSPQQAGKLIYIMRHTNDRLILRLRK